jgi:mRNA interferase MazF
MVNIQRFDVFLITLDPTEGHEINKTRPCLVISPNELNASVRTIIIAPMTTKGRDYPTRVPVEFLNKQGQIVLDQVRTVDKSRLIKKMGSISQSEANAVLDVLQKLFAH